MTTKANKSIVDRRHSGGPARASQRRRNHLLVWAAGLSVVAALIGIAMWSARTTSDASSRPPRTSP